ncbi:cell wall-binding repeat-containing protein [Catenulispora pinisilvae]|uniref:cell wall-binding repeat-containing protein n=1 Tax=Catenulispora pinisilvae TaxID=2705253 RepID=UPI001891FA7D|nr:cell wall-binding repeat-containing protein [Catenulispora pinisilvae]
MTKNRPTAVAALVAAALAAGTIAAAPALAADGGSGSATGSSTGSATSGATGTAAKTVRISGADRYATAIQASLKDFPAAGSANGVVIARGDLYVDALAGTPLATAKHAALLLTDGKSLTDGVGTEIQRVLGPDTAKPVTILGGPDAVSPQVEAQLKALGHQVTRIGGADRYATALDIAGTSGAKTAVVATGTDFADALAAGPLAAYQGSAIVLSNGPTVTDAGTAAFIAHAAHVTSVGQPAVDAVHKLKVDDTELAGADRYATAEAVATQSALKDAKSAVVATGADFADPLVGGVYAAYNKGALLMTDGAKLSLPTARALLEMPGLGGTTIVGGTDAVSQGVQNSIDTVLAGAPQIQSLRDFQVQAQKQAKTDREAVTITANILADQLTAAADALSALTNVVKQNPDTHIGDPLLKLADALTAVLDAKDDNALYTAMQNVDLASRALGADPDATPAEQAAVSSFTTKWGGVANAYANYQKADATAHMSDTRAADAQRAIDEAIAKLIGA